MGSMNFDHSKAGRQSPLGGSLEGVDNSVDTGLVERRWHRITLVERDGARTDNRPTAYVRCLEAGPAFPRRFATGLSPGMSQLNAGNCPL